MIAIKNILVATDFGDAADAALAYGRTLARTFGARLHVLHVIENMFLGPMVQDPYELELAAAKLVGARLTAGERQTQSACAVTMISSLPANAIVDYAKRNDIDLIVTGTHGRSGMTHVLMGSVAEKVMRTAPCPVLTVRHPERKFTTHVASPASINCPADTTMASDDRSRNSHC